MVNQRNRFCNQLFLKQRLDEGCGVEGVDVCGGFAEAYEFYGDVELVADADDDVAFGAAQCAAFGDG